MYKDRMNVLQNNVISVVKVRGHIFNCLSKKSKYDKHVKNVERLCAPSLEIMQKHIYNIDIIILVLCSYNYFMRLFEGECHPF